MIWRTSSFSALMSGILLLQTPAPGWSDSTQPQKTRSKGAPAAQQEAAATLVGSAAAISPGSGRPAKPQPAQDYRIGPGDVLQIDLWKQPEASVSSVTVMPDGQISMPLIDQITVKGLTPAELEQTLTKKYSEFVNQSRVTVLVREVNSQKVYVIGEVKKEGVIRLLAPMTILQAIVEAGGLTDYAKRRKIYVLRMERGNQYVLPFDYDAVVRGQKIEQNGLVVPGDTIIVPR